MIHGRKKIGLTMMAALAYSSMGDPMQGMPDVFPSEKPYSKSPLNHKQAKARKRGKSSAKARKLNR